MSEKIKTLSNSPIYLIFLTFLISILSSNCKKYTENTTVNLYNNKTAAVFNPNVVYGTMTDQDGNIYKTIVIGSQTWMAENLRTTKYRNGDSIPEIINNSLWPVLTSAAYCNYENRHNPDTIATYGRIYNGYAAIDTRNIAPAGWHVPSDAELRILTTFLGGDNVAGGKMKEVGTTHWFHENKGATNESGFTALPAGYRALSDGMFTGLHYASNYWSTTIPESSFANNLMLYNYSGGCGHSDYYMRGGFSIRCLKD